jgi:hypothetical protein
MGQLPLQTTPDPVVKPTAAPWNVGWREELAPWKLGCYDCLVSHVSLVAGSALHPPGGKSSASYPWLQIPRVEPATPPASSHLQVGLQPELQDKQGSQNVA